MKQHIITLIALLLSTLTFADTYQKVTSQSEIVDGGEYFMVGVNGESMYFSGIFDTSNHRFNAISTSGNSKFTSDQYIGDVNKSGFPYTFILAYNQEQHYYNIKLYNNKNFIGTDVNANALSSQIELRDLAYCRWGVEIGNEGCTINLYNSNGNRVGSDRSICFNGNFFGFYSNNKKPTYLYKKVEDVTPSPTTQAVTITDAGWATYFNTDYDLDFSGTGAKVYKAKVRNDKEYVDLIPVTKVPKDKGIIINYDGGGTLNVPIITDVPAWAAADNDLICCTESFAVAEAYRYYILMMPFAFYPVTTDNTNNDNVIPQGRCYIDLGSSSSSKPLSITPTLGTTTGINTIVTENDKTTCRNLLGIPVSTNTPGIIIINGKKVLNK